MLVAEFADGRTVALDRCQWVLLDQCGCPRGTATAGGDLATTEDDAWRAICPDGRRRAAVKRSGARVELMTREDYLDNVVPLILAPACPHAEVAA